MTGQYLPLLAVMFFVGVWWFTRLRTLFHLSVRDGQVLVVSGRVPSRFRQDVVDIVRRGPSASGEIRARADRDGAHLVCSGLDDGTVQRLRNTFRLYPISQLRNAPAIAKPTLGQVLGVAWLAWMFERMGHRG